MESSNTRCNNNTRHTDYGRRFTGPEGRSTIYTRGADKRGNVGRGDGTPSIGDTLKGQYCDMG
eukprot:3003445-Pleurochrysis_carterae.AAC.1